MRLKNEYKFCFQCILDEMELAYQDLIDALGLEYTGVNKRLMRTALAYLIEDVLHYNTEARFRDVDNLTSNLISDYLQQELNLDVLDREDIDDLFIKPLTEDVKHKLAKLLSKYDRNYSKWQVEEGEVFPDMTITYMGDYRIDEWHKIRDVPVSSVVAVKKHRIRFRPIIEAIKYELRNEADLALNDIPILIDKIMEYYSGGEVEELYNEIVLHLKVINNFRRNEHSRRALLQTRSIMKAIESIPTFANFKEDLTVAEKVYSTVTETCIIFDLIMPSKYGPDDERRKEILEQIDQVGYVDKDIPGLLESING